MVVLRWAESEDLREIARISARCFPGYDEAGRLERIRNDPRCDTGDILVAHVDGRMAGGATLIAQGLWTGGVELPTGGVASVQVDPDFRRRGIAQAVMKRIFEAHRERAFCLSMLFPYDPVFYRRLGYSTLVRWIELHLRTASLPLSDLAQSVRTATEEDLDGVIECHRRSLPGRNGGMSRAAEFWKARILTGSRRVAVFEADGRIEGYFIYELTSTGDSLQQHLYVREWVAPGALAQPALLGYLKQQQAQCSAVRLFAPADCPWPHLLAEPRSLRYDNPEHGCYSSGATGTGPMVRVQNLGQLFGSGRRFAGHPLACRFRVVEISPVLVEDKNNPPAEEVVVEFDGTKASVSSRGVSAWFECDPGTMAQVFFGAATPHQAALWGLARADSADTLAKLEVLFRQDAPFVHPSDYF